MAGTIAAAVANFSMGAPKTQLTPADFFPDLPRARARRVNRLSRKQIAKNVRRTMEKMMEADRRRNNA